MDGIITVWVITWRTVWPAMLAAVLFPLMALLLRRRVDAPPLLAFALPLLGPILIIAWSGLFWGAEERTTSGVQWASTTQMVLVLASLALIIWVLVHNRMAPRYWTVIIAAIANFIFVLAAGFVGSMAISNTWL